MGLQLWAQCMPHRLLQMLLLGSCAGSLYMQCWRAWLLWTIGLMYQQDNRLFTSLQRCKLLQCWY